MKTYTSSETTKRNIIEAAGTLAAQLGLDNVSTRAVAEASNENIGSIHYHFGGKDGLFEAVVCEAIAWCGEKDYFSATAGLSEASTPEELSRVVREVIARTSMICFGRIVRCGIRR